MPRTFHALSFVAVATLVAGSAGCQKRDDSRTIKIDGSSTVYPISQAAAEEFPKTEAGKGIKVVVGKSGTGGGFEKFIQGETDINDASRPITESEVKQCEEKGIEYVELKVAIDGLSVVVHKDNDWCDNLTTAELKKIFEQGSNVTKWSDIREGFPEEKIVLFGPDSDSGTYDYFIEAILGKKGKHRSGAGYTPSADDNILVTGVSKEKYALGYFGFAYYVKNQDKLKVVGITPGDDPKAGVKPTPETVESGRYVPLSRPLFLYVRKDSLARPEVETFVKYYLNEGQKLAEETGYVRLSKSQLEEARKRLDEALEE